SVHGFSVGLVHAEANVLGIINPVTNAPVGSGGWANIIDKFEKAKSYCDAPFEIKAKEKKRIALSGEWIGEFRNGRRTPESREVNLYCADSARAVIPNGCLDAVFTDPPYFGHVLNDDLMDFYLVWLNSIVSYDVNTLYVNV